jgi:hypothetical protein
MRNRSLFYFLCKDKQIKDAIPCHGQYINDMDFHFEKESFMYVKTEIKHLHLLRNGIYIFVLYCSATSNVCSSLSN